MITMQTTDVFIELHVDSFQKAIDFYKLLGFEVLYVLDTYMVMQRGKSFLNFYGGDERVFNQAYFKRFPKDTKRGYGMEVIIWVDSIEELKALFEKIKDKVKVVEPLKLQRWGHWDFRIEDPFGFYIRVGDRYDWINRDDFKAETPGNIEKKGLKI